MCKKVLYMCRPRQAGKFIEQIKEILKMEGVTHIVVEEGDCMKQRKRLLEACKAIIEKQNDESIFRLPANCEEIKMVEAAIALAEG